MLKENHNKKSMCVNYTTQTLKFGRISWKENGEDEIVVKKFGREPVEKVPLGRTSTWNCKEELIQIKEARSTYMNETGILCMQVTIISSNTVRIFWCSADRASQS